MGNILKFVQGCSSRDVSSFPRIPACAFESEGTVLGTSMQLTAFCMALSRIAREVREPTKSREHPKIHYLCRATGVKDDERSMMILR